MQHKHRLLFDYICAHITGTIILRILSDSWCIQLHFGTSYNVVARILSDNSLPKRGPPPPAKIFPEGEKGEKKRSKNIFQTFWGITGGLKIRFSELSGP
jgi:hypothetical protein